MAVKKSPPQTKMSSPPVLQKYYTFGLYAESGVGKTTLAATAPLPRFLDSNQGLLAIQGRPGFEQVRSSPIHTIEQFERAYDNFTGTGKRDWTKHKTVVFDHFDDIQSIVLDELNEETVNRDSRRMRDLADQKEWGIMGNRLKRFIRQYKRLPMHKILIFGVSQDRVTGQIVPNLQGQLRSSIGYFCDFLIYMRIGKGGKRYLHFKPRNEFLAKARPWWWTEDRVLVDPTDTKFLTHLFDRIAAAGQDSLSTAK